jgi:hypothetical protein
VCRGPTRHPDATGESAVTALEHAAYAYAIDVDGLLGPLLLTCLPHERVVRTVAGTSLIVSVTDDDLVSVAEKLAAYGLEIDCVRDLGASG